MRRPPGQSPEAVSTGREHRPGAGPGLAAVGPVGQVIRCVRDPGGTQGVRGSRYVITADEAFRSALGGLGAGTSALIMLRRLAFCDTAHRLDEAGERALLRWAADSKLGQDGELIAAVMARREAALAQLERQGLHLARLCAAPEWRLAAGLGNKANAYEIGISLHGTYGWPVIPGSSLKGLAAAWATAADVKPTDIRRILGSPRWDPRASRPVPVSGNSPEQVPDAAPDPALADAAEKREPVGREPAGRGSVRFLDAIPLAVPARIEVDVLAPHVKRYYEGTAPGASGEPAPPAEYHNPEPVHFLTVAGAFAVNLYGHSRDDVRQAACWLKHAGDELGAGGKTAAGYGYLSVTDVAAGSSQS